VDDPKKQDLYSRYVFLQMYFPPNYLNLNSFDSVLVINANSEKKFHQNALDLYESYLDEMFRALRLINNRE
jgi:hypothetical protein